MSAHQIDEKTQLIIDYFNRQVRIRKCLIKISGWKLFWRNIAVFSDRAEWDRSGYVNIIDPVLKEDVEFFWWDMEDSGLVAE